VFAEKGFRGATTRDIAKRAELTEPMVFRYFGSKAALFEEAAVEPVVAFMDGYVEEWGAREHGSTDAVREVRDFTSRLLDVLDADRELLVAIMAAGQFDPALEPAAEQLQEAFGRIIEMFEGMIETEFTIRELETPDRPAFARVLLGLVVAFSLHGDWLQIGTGGVSQDRMLDEAARMTVFGVTDGR
jgi:AcrR family transcriptional regulator